MMTQIAADRQYRYRFFHPQLNLTLRSQGELREIRQACEEQATTPREVLLAWARAATRDRANTP